MLNFRRWLLLILLGAVIPTGPIYAARLGNNQQALERWKEAYGKLPMSFEANQGQSDPAVHFLARGQGYVLFLKGDEAVLKLRERGPAASEASGKLLNEQVLRMRFVGADPAAPMSGVEKLRGVSNYFIGKDPKRWRTDVPNYRKVKCERVYPGIDVLYYGTQQQLEYDLVLAPGARPEKAVLRFEGGDLRVNPHGDLVIKVGSGEVVFHRPEAYQLESESSSAKQPIEARYVLRAKNQVGFRLGRYDATKTVVIDPILSYATYLGGIQGDAAYGITVDASNQAYVIGATGSSDFPTSSAYQGTIKGSQDIFVTKLEDDGTTLRFSTYLGGGSYDVGTGIAVDILGSAYITGSTSSTDFPVTPVESTTSTIEAFQVTAGGLNDAFVAKLDATGSDLIYSSFLGGSNNDYAYGIAVDSLKNAYITGSTDSTNLLTVNPFQGGNMGNGDAFVAKVNQTGTELVYCTYLGGSNADAAQGIAVDAASRAYVAGYTFSSNFPTLNPVQMANAGSADIFVTQLSEAGDELVYSTYVGGAEADRARAIAVDVSGNAYVTGNTESTDFPTTASIFQSYYAGNTDAFVAKLGAAGTGLAYSTFLGGSEYDEGLGVAVNSDGNAYVTGYTRSSTFPKSSSIQASFGGGTCGGAVCPDAFLTEMDPNGASLVYSTYLGGSGADYGYGVAVDSDGYAYAAGYTTSTNFTPTYNAQQTESGDETGVGDAFVVKVDPQDAPRAAVSPQNIDFEDVDIYTVSDVETVTVTNVGTQPLEITEVATSSDSTTATGDFIQTNNCIGTLAPSGGFCTISITFTPSALLSREVEITITDNDDEDEGEQIITVKGRGVTPTTSVTLSPGSLDFGKQTVDVSSAVKSVVLTNTGDVPLEITDIDVTDYFAQTNTCPISPATLAVGGSCTFFVTFTPTRTGSMTGSVTIDDNAGTGMQTISLEGEGTAGFSLSIPQPTQVLTIGEADTEYYVTAVGPAGFEEDINLRCDSIGTATCIFDPDDIKVGETSKLTLLGLTQATSNPFNFQVVGSADGEEIKVPMAIIFSDYTLSASPQQNSVAAGGSAVYKIKMTPANGLTAPVMLSCDTSTLPEDSKCTFSPAAVASEDGVEVVTSTLTITTTERTDDDDDDDSMVLWRRLGAPPSAGSGTPALVTLLCALTLLLVALRINGSRSSRRLGSGNARLLRGRALLVLATLLFVLMSLSVGCSNTIRSLITTTTEDGSQAGNYLITIDGQLGTGTTPVHRTTTVVLSVS